MKTTTVIVLAFAAAPVFAQPITGAEFETRDVE